MFGVARTAEVTSVDRLRDRVLHDPAWGAVPPWADRPDDRARAGP